MTNDEAKLLAAQAAMDKMLKGRYFDICTIDKVIRLLDVVEDRETYEILHALHCVHYADMNRKLYNELPNLIQRLLGGPVKHTVLLTQDSAGERGLTIVQGKPIEVNGGAKRVGIIGRLIGRG